MRRENDYITYNRKSFLHEVVVNCPEDSVLEIEGNLPNELFREYSLNRSSRFVIATNNRKILSEFLQSEDVEIAKNSVGATLISAGSIWFESYHLYDYGAPNESDHIVFIHDSFSDQLLEELLRTKVLAEEEPAT